MKLNNFFLISLFILFQIKSVSSLQITKNLSTKEDEKENLINKLTDKYLEATKIPAKAIKSYINDENVVILDTRQISNSAKEYVQNSILLPLSMFDNWLEPIINKDLKIIIIADKTNYKDSINKIISFGYSFIGYAIYEEIKKENVPTEKVEFNQNTKEEIEKLIKNKEQIVDFREINEYENTGVLPESNLIPLSSLQNNYKKLPKDVTIYATCRSGARATIAMSIIKRAGYKNKFIIMNEGINKLINEGYPLVPYKK